MNINEKIAILFKRKLVNKKGDYVVIPYDYVVGNEVDEKFMCGEATYKNINNYDSINSSIVYGFPTPVKEILNMLEKEGFLENEEIVCDSNGSFEEESGSEILLLNFLDEFLYNMNNYNFYQRLIDKDSKLSTHMYKKYIKDIVTVDTRKLPKTIIEDDMDFVLEDANKEEEKNSKNKQTKPVIATKPFMPEIKRDKNFIDVKELYQTVISYVIGQDEQAKKIISAIAQNQVISNPASKQNILIAGSTGVGKTEIFRIISKYLNLPLVTADATEYTMSGYEGKSVGEMLLMLYRSAGNNEKNAEHGILVVDEIDKLAGGNSTEKVSTTGVLESLLKIVEGGVNTFKNQYAQVSIDTSFVTFVGLGAFSDMNKMVLKREVGFNKETATLKEKFSTDNFEKYGMLPEFIGRCNTRVIMNDLDRECLRRILLESKNSQLRLKQEILLEYGVELIYNSDLVNAIATAAFNKKTGARGLATVVSEMLSDALFEIQCNPGKYNALQIYEDTVTDNTKYQLHTLVRKIKR